MSEVFSSWSKRNLIMLSITSRTYSFVLRWKDTAQHCQGAFGSICNWSLLILSKQDLIVSHRKTGYFAGERKLLCSWTTQRADSVLLLLHLLHSNLLVRCSLPLDLYSGFIVILPLVTLHACIEASCSSSQQYTHTSSWLQGKATTETHSFQHAWTHTCSCHPWN